MNLTHENESVIEKYQRQAERRNLALQSGNFEKYDNDHDDKLLINVEDAYKLGFISKAFYERLHDKSKQIESKVDVNFKFGRLQCQKQ